MRVNNHAVIFSVALRVPFIVLKTMPNLTSIHEKIKKLTKKITINRELIDQQLSYNQYVENKLTVFKVFYNFFADFCTIIIKDIV